MHELEYLNNRLLEDHAGARAYACSVFQISYEPDATYAFLEDRGITDHFFVYFYYFREVLFQGFNQVVPRRAACSSEAVVLF